MEKVSISNMVGLHLKNFLTSVALLSIIFFSPFLFAPTAFAANVTVSDSNVTLVLPSDSSTYSLSTATSFDNLVINNADFVFTIPTGSSVVITSLGSSRELSNTLSLSTICNTSTSVLTINNTSGSPETVTVTPGSACVSSNTTTTSTSPVPAAHFYGQLSHSYVSPTSQTTTTVTTTSVSNTSISSIPRDLILNMTGNDVKMLQEFLNTQGFILAKSGVGSPGFETIFFGTLTKNALIRFQKYYHIVPAVGYFGPITRAVIKNL